MNVDEETDRTVYTLNIPEMVAFRNNADNHPMCKDWFKENVFDMEGWTTIRVPNWTAPINEFFAWIQEHTVSGKVITPIPKWFDTINPVVANKYCNKEEV